jgi:hypothetical protein
MMCRKIGNILSFFFISISIINIIDDYPLTSFHVLGLGVVGILYFISGGGKPLHRILQLSLSLIIGCLFLIWNDVNSMVPIVILGVIILLYQKYFPRFKKGVWFFPLVYITTAIIISWPIVDIVASIVVHIAYSTILYIINNDKVK